MHFRRKIEVCELHRANHYKAILLDMRMLGMNGFQVMKELGLIEADDYVAVFAITAEPAYKLPRSEWQLRR